MKYRLKTKLVSISMAAMMLFSNMGVSASSFEAENNTEPASETQVDTSYSDEIPEAFYTDTSGDSEEAQASQEAATVTNETKEENPSEAQDKKDPENIPDDSSSTEGENSSETTNENNSEEVKEQDIPEDSEKEEKAVPESEDAANDSPDESDNKDDPEKTDAPDDAEDESSKESEKTKEEEKDSKVLTWNGNGLSLEVGSPDGKAFDEGTSLDVSVSDGGMFLDSVAGNLASELGRDDIKEECAELIRGIHVFNVAMKSSDGEALDAVPADFTISFTDNAALKENVIAGNIFFKVFSVNGGSLTEIPEESLTTYVSDPAGTHCSFLSAGRAFAVAVIANEEIIVDEEPDQDFSDEDPDQSEEDVSTSDVISTDTDLDQQDEDSEEDAAADEILDDIKDDIIDDISVEDEDDEAIPEIDDDFIFSYKDAVMNLSEDFIMAEAESGPEMCQFHFQL